MLAGDAPTIDQITSYAAQPSWRFIGRSTGRARHKRLLMPSIVNTGRLKVSASKRVMVLFPTPECR